MQAADIRVEASSSGKWRDESINSSSSAELPLPFNGPRDKKRWLDYLKW
jgi:hypothetical protein